MGRAPGSSLRAQADARLLSPRWRARTPPRRPDSRSLDVSRSDDGLRVWILDPFGETAQELQELAGLRLVDVTAGFGRASVASSSASKLPVTTSSNSPSSQLPSKRAGAPARASSPEIRTLTSSSVRTSGGVPCAAPRRRDSTPRPRRGQPWPRSDRAVRGLDRAATPARSPRCRADPYVPP